MVQISILNILNKKDFEETKRGLLDSYQQYEHSFESVRVYEDYMESIRNSLYNPGIDKVFIAKDENGVIGSLQVFADAKKAYQLDDFDAQIPIIRLLAVSPLARHKGVARSLINETITYLTTKGQNTVYLHTSEVMVDAIKLYERYGFKRYTPYDFYKNERLVACYRFFIN